MDTVSISTRSAIEVSHYQLSDLEKDTLNNYQGLVSVALMRALRGGIMVFHNILYELWLRGVRLRIVPRGTRIVDLPECIDLRRFRTPDGKYSYESNFGLYRPIEKLIVVREEEILVSRNAERKYETLIHEFAHAIWYEILTPQDRGEVLSVFRKYLQKREDGDTTPGEHWRVGYSRKNVAEFFAENFLYFVTPYRQGFLGGLLGVITNIQKREDITWVHTTEETILPTRENQKNTNPEMFAFLSAKFKGVIEPELVMGKPDDADEIRFDLHHEKGLYYFVIYCGTINSIGTFSNL